MAAVTSAVIAVGGAVMSFREAADQKELANSANIAAAKAMKEARDKAGKDYYAGIAVPLDAYEAQFENNLAVAQQTTAALQEGDPRNLAAGAGAIGAVSAQNAEQTRIKMGQEMSDLNIMKADSKDDINQQLMEMDVAAAKEQNMRERDAQAARAAAISSGVSSVTSGLDSAASVVPLYRENKISTFANKMKGAKPIGMSDADWMSKMKGMNINNKEMQGMSAENAFWDDENNAFGWGLGESANAKYGE